jgi:protoporphyrinogen oxidase
LSKKTAVIIGAGPAGLTAAYELAKRAEISPIVLESGNYIGGISRTVNYKGNRIDIGGHRFFSKSDRVMKWWDSLMPIEKPGIQSAKNTAERQNQAPADKLRLNQTAEDRIMLVRNRKSRILFQRKFFDYPINLSVQNMAKLGFFRVIRIIVSYIKSRIMQIGEEINLEQFLINRFGNELYQTFFKSYTEKVWGMPCSEIDAAWGAQRIKGLSVSTAIKHVIRQMLRKDKDLSQRNTETSLIERFLYPKYGPGQMWEVCAHMVGK